MYIFLTPLPAQIYGSCPSWSSQFKAGEGVTDPQSKEMGKAKDAVSIHKGHVTHLGGQRRPLGGGDIYAEVERMNGTESSRGRGRIL